MKAHLISIGDELLIGQVINTNAAFLAREMHSIGLLVTEIVSVKDEGQAIKDALDRALHLADVVLITGGLGPTKDDITKKALCEYFNTRLILNKEVLKQVESLFAQRGLPLLDVNRDQAMVPEAAIALKNIHGTAPGLWFERGGKIVAALPGVPYEMESLLSNEVIPRILAKGSKQAIYYRTVLTQGIGESLLAEQIEEWEDSLPSWIKLAYLPQPGMVRLRLTAVGDDYNAISRQVEERIARLQSIIPQYIFGYDDDTLEKITGDLLRSAGASLCTAESCTGGYLAHLITSVPGSSDYFKGSVIAYSNVIKQKILEVPEATLLQYGAVSEPVVKLMAENARKLLETDYSIALSGVAGPAGGSLEKPVGTTWIAVSGPKGIVARRFQFGEHRGRNIRKAALQSLNMFREYFIL